MNNAILNTVLQSIMFIGLASVFILLLIPVISARFSKTPDRPSRHMFAITDSISHSQRGVMARTKKLLEIHNGKAQLEIVALGNGVPLLTKDSHYHKDITTLMEKGVVFSACQKSLDVLSGQLGRSLEMLDGVKIVEHGVQYTEYLKDQGYINEVG